MLYDIQMSNSMSLFVCLLHYDYVTLVSYRSPHSDGPRESVPGALAAGSSARGVLELRGPGSSLAGAQGHIALCLLRRCRAA